MAGLDIPGGRYVDLGGPVHYAEWDGPPGRTFVLVHGLGGSHLQWVRVAPELARHGRVLAVDLAGFGRTPRAGRSAKLTAQRVLLARFIDEVVGGPVVLAGHSMGGAIAIMQASIEPSSVSGLVLTASVFPWEGVQAALLRSPALLAGFVLYRGRLGEWAARQRVNADNADRIVRLSLRLMTTDAAALPEDLVRAHVALLTEQARDPDVAAAFLESSRSLIRLGQTPERARTLIDGVKCPVVVIHGRRDRLVPAALAWTATESHPDWMVRVLPDVGHIPQMEAPERWMRSVEDWLTAASL